MSLFTTIATPPAPTLQLTPTPSNTPRATVLVFDEDPGSRLDIQRMSDILGVDCTGVVHVEELEALLCYRRPEVIFIDLRGQDKSAVQALHVLREQAFGGRVVFMASAKCHFIDSAMRFGSNLGLHMARPIEKPVTFGSFEAILKGSITDETAVDLVGSPRDLGDFRWDALLCRYRPLIRLDSKQLVGAEALIHLETGGEVIGPERFKPTLEKLGRLPQLTRYLRRMAFRDAARADLDMTIEVTTQDLEEPSFTDATISTAQTFGLSPEKITFLLASEAMAGAGTQMLSSALALRAAGFQLSLGDFVLSRSSLAFLGEFPFSEIRLSRRLVSVACEDPSVCKAAASTVAVAHQLGLATVGEGVETEGEAQLLASMGCGKACGRLFQADDDVRQRLDELGREGLSFF